MIENEESTIVDFVVGIPILAAIIYAVVLLVKGIFALVAYIFSVLEDLSSGITQFVKGVTNNLYQFCISNQDYILSTEFLVHTLAAIGAVYLASHLFIPFCKVVDSLMEIVVVLPFMMVGWIYDILRGTFLFIQKALVRPWNPDYDNDAPSFENRGLNN